MNQWEEAAQLVDRMGSEWLALMDSQPRRKTAYLQKFGAAQDIARALRAQAAVKCDYPACFCAIKCDEIHDDVTFTTPSTAAPA